MLTREERNVNRRLARAARQDRSYQQYVGEIFRLYNSARPEKGALNHSQIRASMENILERVYADKHTNNSTYDRLRGVIDCMIDVLFTDVLVSTCMLDGVRVLSRDVPDGRWCETSDPQSGVFRDDGSFVAFLD